MINGIHTMFYTPQPEAARAFIRDVLGFPSVDVGDGWLIFDTPPADMGCHPSGGSTEHAISFRCDDIHRTMAELQNKGVQFTKEVTDEGYGLVTSFMIPGGVVVDLYQPEYDTTTSKST